MIEILENAFCLFLKIVLYGAGIVGGLLFLGVLIDCMLTVKEWNKLK